MNSHDCIVRNVVVYDFVSFRKEAFVHFREHILHVGDMDDFNDYILTVDGFPEVHEGEGHLLLPTFVAAHTHVYSAFARGMSVPFSPETFQDILDQLWWKLDRELDSEAVYCSGIASALDFIRSGVTLVFDHHASGRIIEGALDELQKSMVRHVGMRGGFCFETSDRFDVDACIRENMDFIKQNASSKDAFGLFGLHASMSLSDESLKAVKKAVGHTPIHMHVAESLEDEALCVDRYGKRIVERLDDFGLLNKDSILVHCIHIDDREAELISQRGCYVALNPTSNMNNGVGLPDIRLLKKYHIPCLVGNDGMTADIASEWRNLVFCMHHRTESPTGFSPDDLKAMIINSYEYANRHMDCKIGRIKKGYDSDLMLVSYQAPTTMDETNVFSHLLFGLFHNFRPKDLWCKDRWLIKEYRYAEDELGEALEILKGSPKVADEVWKKVKE